MLEFASKIPKPKTKNVTVEDLLEADEMVDEEDYDELDLMRRKNMQDRAVIEQIKKEYLGLR